MMRTYRQTYQHVPPDSVATIRQTPSAERQPHEPALAVLREALGAARVAQLTRHTRSTRAAYRLPLPDVTIAHVARFDGRPDSSHITVRHHMASRPVPTFDVYVFPPGIARSRRQATSPAQKEYLSSFSYFGETHRRKATRLARGKALSIARAAKLGGYVGETYAGGTTKLVHQWLIADRGVTRRGTPKLVAVAGYAFAATKPETKSARKARHKATRLAGRKATQKSARKSTAKRKAASKTTRPAQFSGQRKRRTLRAR